ncbi:MAG TPA: FtsX-like permease family protein [Puia sp.]|nr:FtsX-like permease family protein [Puia sp.]
MFRHNLHIAWRQWRASLSYSLINLGGLTAGLTIALLIGLWIADELSFDHYFPNHSRIVKLMRTTPSDAGLVTSDLQAPPLVAELKANHSSLFRHLAIVWPNFPHALSAGGTKLIAEGQWAQPEWSAILCLHMIRGSRNALDDPSSTLIDRSTAIALFGEKTDPVGRTIRVDNSVNVKVAGIYEDLPANTTFAGTHILLAWNKAGDEMAWFKDVQQDWGATGFWIFGELNDAEDQATADKDIHNILQTHLKGSKDQLSLYPMDRWHLYSEFREGKSESGHIRIVLFFTLIGIFVLLLACINFMNLSTARSEHRAREIGIRKTLGSLRHQLIVQFLGESIFLAIMACTLAIILAQLSLPLFNQLANKHLGIPYGSPWFWLLTISFTIFTGLISGSYPALYLSRFKPVKVLYGCYRNAASAAIARKSLVILQFTISVGLIIGTAIVYRQVEFAKARPIGYDRDGLIAIRMNTSDVYSADYNSLRDDLLQSGAVIDMAQSANEATEQPPNADISWEAKDPNSRPPFTLIEVTYDFGRTIGWNVSAGRDFSRAFTTDSNAVVINESAARLIGWNNPIGKTLHFWAGDRRIIGVIKDIVLGSPYQPVIPTIFPMSYKDVNYITIRLNPALNTSAALNEIAGVFRKYDPQSPFEPHFLADDYALKFTEEQQVARIASVFAILAIFISCLGLFGLASYMAEQRTKEIGIRKVLGATVTQLITLLSIDFLRLILLALALAIPLSAWAMQRWLLDYPYHAALSPWIFAAAGTGAIGIALLTVCTQALRAALANPIQSLRSE